MELGQALEAQREAWEYDPDPDAIVMYGVLTSIRESSASWEELYELPAMLRHVADRLEEHIGESLPD